MPPKMPPRKEVDSEKGLTAAWTDGETRTERQKKGERDEIKKYAEEQGKSLNAYIVELIEKDMKKAAD